MDQLRDRAVELGRDHFVHLDVIEHRPHERFLLKNCYATAFSDLPNFEGQQVLSFRYDERRSPPLRRRSVKRLNNESGS